MGFKDVIGGISPKKMFNIWRFKTDPGTFKLVDTWDLEVKKPELFQTLPELHRMTWTMKDIGEQVDKKMDTVECDAWVISTMYEMEDKIIVSVDTFKKDTLWDKIIYKLKKTFIKDKQDTTKE